MSEIVKVKEYTIELTITEEQKALLERAASLKGVSLKAYTLLNVLVVAKEEIEAYEVLVLSDRDREWKRSEIDAALAEMVSDPEYQAEVLHLEDEFATAQWEALQLAEFPEL